MTDGAGRLSEFTESLGDALLSRAGRLSARYQERRGLESDLLESDDAYLVVFDAPGATSSDLQVRYLDGAVLVRLDRFRDYHEGYEMRFPGRGLSIDAEVELPGDALVNAEAATATLTGSGTLEVELPKVGPPDEELATDEGVESAGGEDGDHGSGDDDPTDGDADADDAADTGSDDEATDADGDAEAVDGDADDADGDDEE